MRQLGDYRRSGRATATSIGRSAPKVGSGASSTSPTNVNLIAATLDNTCSIVWFRKLASDQIKNTLLPLLQSWPPATAVLPISR
uniref:Uncharacterized protein n=1 Tax=Oryza rufipogon TaxID=4529 RepID=A0A0E0Q8R5_ORYRU